MSRESRCYALPTVGLKEELAEREEMRAKARAEYAALVPIVKRRAKRIARQNAVAGWFLEVASLLVVFPILDQLVSDRPFRWEVAGAAVGFAFLLFGVGVYYTRGD